MRLCGGGVCWKLVTSPAINHHDTDLGFQVLTLCAHRESTAKGEHDAGFGALRQRRGVVRHHSQRRLKLADGVERPIERAHAPPQRHQLKGLLLQVFGGFLGHGLQLRSASNAPTVSAREVVPASGAGLLPHASTLVLSGLLHDRAL
jgi:hypothetical protein